MSKLELKLLNDPYNNYGILTEDHMEEIAFLGQFFKTDEYIDLYNKCLIDVSKKIYRGKIKIRNGVLKVKLDPDYIRQMTRNDLQIISKIGSKLNANMSYGDLKKFYTTDQFPLSPIEKLTNGKLKCATTKSYPTTHYEFFKYEDFDTFNWTVYYRYIADKYKKKFNKEAPSYSQIEKNLGIFNKLILEVKMAFNRLRPLQTSFIEQIPIKTYITYAGQTPALPSGHSSQGFLFGALIYYNFKQYFDSLNSTDIEYELHLLVRVCKDTGHRRIMAGIHYPSDMLASWVMFDHVLKHLKIDNQVGPYYEKLKLELKKF
jgi:hypothetical protein